MATKRELKNTFADFLSEELTKDPKYVPLYLDYLKELWLEKSIEKELYEQKYAAAEGKKKLTYDEVAFLLDVNKSTVCRWTYRDGASQPSGEQLYTMSKAFKLPVDYILGLVPSINTEINEDAKVMEKYGFDPKTIANLYNTKKRLEDQAKEDGAEGIEQFNRMMYGANMLLQQPPEGKNGVPAILFDIGQYFFSADKHNPYFYYDEDDFENHFDLFLDYDKQYSAEELKDLIRRFKDEACIKKDEDEKRRILLSEISTEIKIYFDTQFKKSNEDETNGNETNKED